MDETIVLLHGGNGSSAEMEPLAALLPLDLDVRMPDLLGHGGRPPPESGCGVADFTEDLLDWLDAERITRAFLFGYSFGGYVALHCARHYPQRVRGVAALATRFTWDAKHVAHVLHLGRVERLTRPGNPRAAELERAHHPVDWRLVNAANMALWSALEHRPALTDDDLRAVTAPVLLLGGRDDPLVPAAEIEAKAPLFAHWRTALFDGSSHPLSANPLPAIAEAVTQFVADVVEQERRRLAP